MRNLSSFICVLFLWSCLSDDDQTPGFQDFQVRKLLTADSNKSWQPVSRLENGFQVELTPSQLNSLLVFELGIDTLGLDSNTVYRIDIDTVDNNSVNIDTLFIGTWSLFNRSNPIDTINVINDNDSVPWIIHQLTSQFLDISFQDTASDNPLIQIQAREEYLGQVN